VRGVVKNEEEEAVLKSIEIASAQRGDSNVLLEESGHFKTKSVADSRHDNTIVGNVSNRDRYFTGNGPII
jgi:hypothetical protein